MKRIGWLVGAILGGSVALFAAPDMTPVQVAPADRQVTPVERLIAESDCNLREGVIPGHAVVTTDSTGPRLAHSDVGFAIWLGPDGRAETGDEKPGTIHAFCR